MKPVWSGGKLLLHIARAKGSVCFYSYCYCCLGSCWGETLLLWLLLWLLLLLRQSLPRHTTGGEGSIGGQCLLGAHTAVCLWSESNS